MGFFDDVIDDITGGEDEEQQDGSGGNTGSGDAGGGSGGSVDLPDSGEDFGQPAEDPGSGSSQGPDLPDSQEDFTGGDTGGGGSDSGGTGGGGSIDLPDSGGDFGQPAEDTGGSSGSIDLPDSQEDFTGGDSGDSSTGSSDSGGGGSSSGGGSVDLPDTGGDFGQPADDSGGGGGGSIDFPDSQEDFESGGGGGGSDRFRGSRTGRKAGALAQRIEKAQRKDAVTSQGNKQLIEETNESFLSSDDSLAQIDTETGRKSEGFSQLDNKLDLGQNNDNIGASKQTRTDIQKPLILNTNEKEEGDDLPGRDLTREELRELGFDVEPVRAVTVSDRDDEGFLSSLFGDGLFGSGRSLEDAKENNPGPDVFKSKFSVDQGSISSQELVPTKEEFIQRNTEKTTTAFELEPGQTTSRKVSGGLEDLGVSEGAAGTFGRAAGTGVALGADFVETVTNPKESAENVAKAASNPAAVIDEATDVDRNIQVTKNEEGEIISARPTVTTDERKFQDFLSNAEFGLTVASAGTASSTRLASKFGRVPSPRKSEYTLSEVSEAAKKQLGKEFRGISAKKDRLLGSKNTLTLKEPSQSNFIDSGSQILGKDFEGSLRKPAKKSDVPGEEKLPDLGEQAIGRDIKGVQQEPQSQILGQNLQEEQLRQPETGRTGGVPKDESGFFDEEIEVLRQRRERKPGVENVESDITAFNDPDSGKPSADEVVFEQEGDEFLIEETFDAGQFMAVGLRGPKVKVRKPEVNPDKNPIDDQVRSGRVEGETDGPKIIEDRTKSRSRDTTNNKKEFVDQPKPDTRIDNALGVSTGLGLSQGNNSVLNTKQNKEQKQDQDQGIVQDQDQDNKLTQDQDNIFGSGGDGRKDTETIFRRRDDDDRVRDDDRNRRRDRDRGFDFDFDDDSDDDDKRKGSPFFGDSKETAFKASVGAELIGLTAEDVPENFQDPTELRPIIENNV